MDDLRLTYERWVHPFYLRLLHGNFRGRCLAREPSEERDRLIKSFQQALREIDCEVIDRLLEQFEWRARLVAAWFSGLRGWVQYRDVLGRSLIESRVCFAGQGYCAALACFADRESAELLCTYLDTWLPQTDKFYDQPWALPALVWVDARLGTEYSSKYLEPGGLWDRWAAAWRGRVVEAALDVSGQRFRDTMRCAIEYFVIKE